MNLKHIIKIMFYTHCGTWEQSWIQPELTIHADVNSIGITGFTGIVGSPLAWSKMGSHASIDTQNIMHSTGNQNILELDFVSARDIQNRFSA